ncbi:hypothetical protein C2G38_2078505 [Gigaspora rosea]|uniref:Uncharacterized protein n=1 Tax=Gigaspora rosea TaxID=44941 RepID=A0A397VHD3_9GLOM|nr:hypothetical protein C2G38_2078505 [Gigaspora rosea]
MSSASVINKPAEHTKLPALLCKPSPPNTLERSNSLFSIFDFKVVEFIVLFDEYLIIGLNFAAASVKFLFTSSSSWFKNITILLSIVLMLIMTLFTLCS